ncbi:hypothetical protein JCM16161A_12800 [Vulcanisaeta sp. JCM 16161]|uniref:hypothetical protein n=1 Tax=Vulcanisaeta sp. JCM 16161 TaxID=1295372 RepID=UPI00406C3073
MIDEESRGKDRAVNDVLTYMMGFEDRVRVVLVQPKHEAWLCIGLGFDKIKCRKQPEDVLRYNKGNYEKRYLAEWANNVDIGKLRNEPDFQDYLDALNWLLKDP